MNDRGLEGERCESASLIKPASVRPSHAAVDTPGFQELNGEWSPPRKEGANSVIRLRSCASVRRRPRVARASQRGAVLKGEQRGEGAVTRSKWIREL